MCGLGDERFLHKSTIRAIFMKEKKILDKWNLNYKEPPSVGARFSMMFL